MFIVSIVCCLSLLALNLQITKHTQEIDQLKSEVKKLQCKLTMLLHKSAKLCIVDIVMATWDLEVQSLSKPITIAATSTCTSRSAF